MRTGPSPKSFSGFWKDILVYVGDDDVLISREEVGCRSRPELSRLGNVMNGWV